MTKIIGVTQSLLPVTLNAPLSFTASGPVRQERRAETRPAVMAMRAFARTLGVSASLLAFDVDAHAIELEGAWANDKAVCFKVFVRQGNRIAVSKKADLYGSGFVVKDNRIRGNIATCTIRSRKEDGAVLHLHTSCSTDVALQDVQFSVRSENENTITRIFPGMPELDRTYYRC